MALSDADVQKRVKYIIFDHMDIKIPWIWAYMLNLRKIICQHILLVTGSARQHWYASR